MNFGQRGNQKIIKYNPLPSYLTIANSDLNGLGLFATKDISEGTNLGIAHILIPHAEETFAQSYCRTPLGGFYNHSKDPNVDWDIDLSERVVQFVAVKDIKAGEELLFNYESPLVNH